MYSIRIEVVCPALMVGYLTIRSTHFRKFDRIFKWCVVHYDEVNDIYFTVETNDWEVFPVVSKYEIEKETALDVINKYSEYNKLDKELSEFFGVEQ